MAMERQLLRGNVKPDTIKPSENRGFKTGANRETRTPDPLITNQ